MSTNATHRTLWARSARFRFWLTATTGALALTYAGSEAGRLIDQLAFGRPTPGNHVLSLVVCFVILAALGYLGFLQREVLTRPRTRLRQIHKPPKRRHLTLFVSNLAPGRHDDKTGFPIGFQPSGKLTTDLNALVALKDTGGAFWPWEMILRGVVHHVPRLEAVSALCSTVSIAQAHLLRHVLSCYPEFQNVKFQLLIRRNSGIDLVDLPTTPFKDGGWDFEDFDEMCDGLLELFARLGNRERPIQHREITVNLTGGYKVTSVVAAAVTFNRDVMAQYVQTERSKNHEPIGYDWLIDDPSSAGAA